MVLDSRPYLRAGCCFFDGPPATAGGSDFLGPDTRGPKFALSTFYRTHRGYGFLFVTGDDHEVAFLDGA